MTSPVLMKRLKKIFDEAPVFNINDDNKFIIFSDIHNGNGGFNDDFTKNSNLFINVLKNHYLKKGYKLILNGDVEELYKFSLKKIEKAWAELYNVFDEFHNKNSLFKIYGNHDYELNFKHNHRKYQLYQAIKLCYKENDIFIYHGHQTAHKLEQYSKYIGFFVKYLLRTFSNKPVPYEDNRKYNTEEIAFEFAAKNKIISILGHTHRPLFESVSKTETVKNIIENLINKYQQCKEENKLKIEEQIKRYKQEFDKLVKKDLTLHKRSSIYNISLTVPCLFNSGAVTGKRGITGIEIKNGKIALVYWFDKNRSQRYLHYKDVVTKRLGKSDFYRAILRKDSLDYIFSRIKLLG
jgi:predicted phosphodiesterase